MDVVFRIRVYSCRVINWFWNYNKYRINSIMITIKDNEEYLLLKWGTLKGWCIRTEEGMTALKKWGDIDGVSLSVMDQNNTDAHKLAICELIDVMTGTIQNDWSGEMYSKEQAKDYIMNYGKKS